MFYKCANGWNSLWPAPRGCWWPGWEQRNALVNWGHIAGTSPGWAGLDLAVIPQLWELTSLQKTSWGHSPASPGGRCTAGLGCSPVSIGGGKSIPCSAFKDSLIINIKMPTDLQWEEKKIKWFVTLSSFTWNNSSEPGADFKHKEVPGWGRWRCTPWKGQAAAETSVCSSSGKNEVEAKQLQRKRGAVPVKGEETFLFLKVLKGTSRQEEQVNECFAPEFAHLV